MKIGIGLSIGSGARRLPGDSQGVDLTAGLAAFWAMDNAADADQMDLAGPNHLLAESGVASELVAGKVGGALRFDPDNGDQRAASSAAALQFMSPGTHVVSMWARLSGDADSGLLMKCKVPNCSARTAQADAAWDGGSSYAINFAVGGHNITYSANVPADEWHMLTFVYDTESHFIGVAVDGSLETAGLGSLDLSPDTGKWVVGASNLSTCRGVIDAVGKWLFDRGLGEQDLADFLAALYNGGNGWEPDHDTP